MEEGPSLDVLLSMSLRADSEAIRRLPPPEKSALGDAETGKLAAATVRFRSMAGDLLLDHESLVEGGVIDGETSFWELFEPIITYYGFSFFHCSLDADFAEALGDFISDHPIDFAGENDGFDPPYLDHAWGLIALHDTLVFQLLTAARVDRLGFQTAELPENYDSDLTVIDGALEFHRFYCADAPVQRPIADRLLDQALEFRRNVLKDRYLSHRARADEGQSEIGSRELELLSRRHGLMADKYGAKRIERIFEQKLDLLFQSLGFTVIPARPGEAEADLLCISRQERFAFLVDAKSTRGKYALPKTDQRALVDYVGSFSRKLPDLPELSFVLLAGSQVASTVPAKLKALERRLGIPIRFIPANVLGRLAQELPGPVSGGVLRDSIIASDFVVSEKIIAEMRAEFDSVVSAYTEFVAKLRGSGS